MTLFSFLDMSRLKAERTALVRLLNKSEDAFFSVHDRINGDSEIELLGFNNMIYYDYVNKVGASDSFTFLCSVQNRIYSF